MATGQRSGIIHAERIAGLVEVAVVAEVEVIHRPVIDVQPGSLAAARAREPG